MSKAAYNTFIVLIGFCFIGLPIILISMSTAPPGLDEFQSTININTISGDANSAIYLNNTLPINGSSSFYWDDLKPSDELAYIYNLTELILEEKRFMKNVSIDDYIGYSKLIHVFVLDLTIEEAPTTNVTAIEDWIELSDNSSSTFQSYFWLPDDYRSFYFELPGYNPVNDSITTVYERTSVEYAISIDFQYDNGTDELSTSLSFQRYLLLDSSGTLLYFVTNEFVMEP